MKNIRKAAWIESGKVERQERWEYPPDAVREAIVNAICHRDYETTSNVQIRMFDDRIEVWNPVTLPEELTPEILKGKHESIPRNPLIAKMLFLIKEIEQWGTGTNEMVNMCLERGLPEPEFEETNSSFVVNIRKHIITEEMMDELGLNERQKAAVEYLKDEEKITTKEYCEMFDVVKSTANRDLNDLLEKKLIKREGKGPETHYRMTTVRYRSM